MEKTSETTPSETLEIEDRETALEALESFDPALTKRALRFLVDQGDPRVLPRILPLTQHPNPALRFVAKRAVKELRELPARPAPITSTEAVEPPQEVVPKVVGGEGLNLLDMDPRLEALLEAPARRRPRRPRKGGVPMRWFDMEL